VFSQISFTSQSFALAPNTRKEFHEVENQLVAGDFNILEMKELRNMLEAYSYEMRNNLDSYGTLEKYLDEPTKKTFIAEINEVVEWIYGDGEQAPVEEYRKKIEKFKAIGEPVKNRHFYYSELDLYFAQFDELSKRVLSRNENTEHITPEQQESVKEKVALAQKLMDQVKADRLAK
jgi:heat shock protein 4